MSGLVRARDVTRPRDCWSVMVCGGVERLTEALRRGDAFDAPAQGPAAQGIDCDLDRLTDAARLEDDIAHLAQLAFNPLKALGRPIIRLGPC